MLLNVFVHNLLIFVLSQSVCQTRLEKPAKDKHSSLLQKFINYDQIKFCNIVPRSQTHKTFPHKLTHILYAEYFHNTKANIVFINKMV